jgi:L-ascorbate metabolism protein UlaG (beta-lactamase superfamily)
VAQAGARVLLDPVLTQRLAHLGRRRGQLPHDMSTSADVVAISHLHADHLHIPSLRAVDPAARLVVPRGAAPLLRDLPHEITEVSPGDTIRVADSLTIEVVRAAHPASRFPGSRHSAVPVGYVLAGLVRTYFPGDTSLDQQIVAQAGAVDVLLAPVGGWGPSLGEGHMGPEEGAQMVQWLAPDVAIPVHWGTFWPRGLRGFRDHLFHQPGPQFAEAVYRRCGEGVRVAVLEPGGTTTIR